MIYSNLLAYPSTMLLKLYTSMARIRAVEDCIAEAYPQQKIRCPVHLSTGQEAISAGACLALEPEDTVLATHRSHGVYLAKNGDIYAFFKELYGKQGGCTQGRGGSMHLAAPEVGFLGGVPIVGSSIALATGVALAYALRQEAKVCLVFFGDGATEEGTFQESLQYAALKQLPIVYICENNCFSVNTPLHERRSARSSLPAMAHALGLAADTGDGNNAVEVYAKSRAAIANARSGKGPTFLEFSTYRWLEHCGHADDHHLPVRDAALGAAWKKKCPLMQLENALVQAKISTHEALQHCMHTERTIAQKALHEAEQAPWPDTTKVADKVYAHA